MIRFQIFLNQGNHCSLNASGVPFTWTNNQRDNTVIYERLDMVVANPQWFNIFPSASLENLPIVGTDHGPGLFVFLFITSLVLILISLNLKLFGLDIQVLLR